MRFMSTRTHGIVDYVLGIILIIAPFVLGFNFGGAEMWVPIIIGVVTIIYSLFTAYEPSLAKSLPMRTHLTLDFIAGVILAVSPWLFGFSELVWAPHLILGLIEIVSSLSTRTVPREAGVSPVRTHTA